MRRLGFAGHAGWLAVLAVGLTGCARDPQTALDPAASEARITSGLISEFTILLTVIFVIVIGVALAALFRRHRGIEQEPLEHMHRPSSETERKLWRWVGGASILTTVILLGLITISVSAGKALSDRAIPPNALTIEVTANQWWWYVRYLNDDPQQIIVTANEIHIPVGRPVMIRGTSNDVIHSFWVPNLSGKRDLIPSLITTEWFEAERPGSFRGQCAEFCGLQHAHMALWVVAEDEQKFNEWRQGQLKDAINPSTPSEQLGRQVFEQAACAMCHEIRGTSAHGQVAPDLTHIASRISIAAGTLPNNRGNLGGWISDPQTIKPGNHMATVPLRSDQLQPVLDYLGILK
jgi:cytochrome c oxidase subunit II